MPCGFDIARTRREMPALTQDPRWHTLRAVREGRVFLTDGNQFFNRPGPRLVESARILAEILHPEHFANSHAREGMGHVRESAPSPRPSNRVIRQTRREPRGVKAPIRGKLAAHLSRR